MKSRLSLFASLLPLLVVLSCRIQNNPPELTGLTPPKTFVGEEISLTGYQFGADPVVTVGVGATAVVATIRIKDDNAIRAIVPVVAPGQGIPIRVSNDEGTSDPLFLDVQQPSPTLTNVAPGNGLPGTSVVLTGTYLNQLKQVRFGDVVAVVRDSSVQQLTVVVPTNVPRGPLAITVETAGGILSGRFIVAGTPQISSVSPKVTRPGAEIVIQGVNLTDGVVRINDQQMDRSRTTVKDTEIRTIIPQFANTGRITVTVFEQLIVTSADTVQVVQPPFITNLGARDGIAGDKLLLAGRNLRDVSAVSFGSVSVPFRILSNTEIEATVPALLTSGSVGVSVSGVGGSHTATDPFFFYQAPSNITVNLTRQVRSRPITISGQNLYRITDVRVNGQSIPITERIEGSQLFVNVPSDGTSGPVTVVNRAGLAQSAPLIVVQPPLITDIIPTKAKLGDRVVLRGDFLLNAQVFFTGTTLPAAEGGKNEDLERWVLVPNGARTGPIRVVNGAGETTTTPFTVVQLITGVDFSPKTAKVGDIIVLTGQNLTSVQEVRFGNGTSAAAKFLVDDAGQFVVTVPAGATTGQICLINEAGTACTSGILTVVK